MIGKKCSKCNIEKGLSDFYRRKTGPRSNTWYEKCKDCMKTRGRSYYHLNRDKQLPLAIERRHKAYLLKSNFIREIKSHPCMDCGKRYPYYVMDFDHRDRSAKIENIARMSVSNWSLEKIKAEIAKCDIVCANCHRIRTFSHTNN